MPSRKIALRSGATKLLITDRMKKILLTAIALFILQLPFASSLKAQSQQQRTTLTGKVLDAESGDPIAYATVTVATADSLMSPVNAVAADMGGSFSLIVKEPGDYKFVVSYVGYTSYIADLAITGGDKKLDMGIIKITEGTEIEGESETVQKPLIKVETDKIVYSVTADLEKEYIQHAEILRKVPQLSDDVDDNGHQNEKVEDKVPENGTNSDNMSTKYKERQK